MKYSLLFLLAVLAFACPRKIEVPPVPELGPPPVNVLIDDRSEGYAPCEPSIAISPLDPDVIVAGAILDRVYRSADGGKTWQAEKLTSPYGVFGDPVVLADYSGNFYYAHLSDPKGTGWQSEEILDRIVVQRSDDGGLSWTDGTFPGNRHPKDQDKHWLATDPRNHHLYMSWTEFDAYGSKKPEDRSRILFARSTDRGDTWSEPLILSELEGDCIDDDQTTEGAVPAVGPNGEVYVAWAYDNKIYFDRSTDGGRSWLANDIFVADQPGGWVFDIPGIYRCNGLPVTVTDLSNGPHRGTIYVNWSDQRHGTDDTDVWISKSTDRGDTWSKPKRINKDKAGKHQFFNWLTVDPGTGHLYCVYYDRRAYDDNKTDVYLAWSTDGGDSWQERRISETSFTPNKRVFFGDYNNISAINGRVRPIWTRLDGLDLSVWTAIVEFSAP